MATRKVAFVLCLFSSLLIVNLAANAAFPDNGDIPDPPGHGDNPAPPGHGDNPNPPGPGDNPNPPGNGGGPPDGQTLGLENALEHVGEDNPGNAYDVIDYLSGLEERPPEFPPGLGHSPPGPSGLAPTAFEPQTLGSDLIGYSATPEPATLALLLLGGLALLRRRP